VRAENAEQTCADEPQYRPGSAPAE